MPAITDIQKAAGAAQDARTRSWGSPDQLTEAEEMLNRLRAEYGNARGAELHRAWLSAMSDPNG